MFVVKPAPQAKRDANVYVHPVSGKPWSSVPRVLYPSSVPPHLPPCDAAIAQR